ncbi:transcription factor CP2 isoform X3 [Hydra vulgaris]|uniref:Transcription factor CP2 isoform X3 n=1 Tax=Hydra vulgaris TaxID=6087 RepID=A0ABM4CW25_HYDVU
MDIYEEKFSANNTWCIDDLDGGLAVDLINLQCVRQSTQLIDDHNPAYDMTEVLELPIFKHADLDSRELLQSLQSSLQESSNGSFNKLFQSSSLETNQLTRFYNENIYTIIMKAPTAPGRKVEEETLTWLNQGQPYEVIIQTSEDEKKKIIPGKMTEVVLSIGFHERQHQYFESEKYEEWLTNRPDVKMIELDMPMSLGVYNPVYVGQYTKEIEFKWDPSTDAHFFIKVNCLSSEFTKTKSGESGVVLRLQLDILGFDYPHKEPKYSAGCQIKVFRAKGANRKLKLEREKHDCLSKEESALLQPSQDITIFTKLDESKRMRRFNSETPIKKEGWSPNASPTYNTCNTFFTGSSQFESCNSSLASTPGVASPLPTLTASSTVEETETWLRYNRFQKYCSCFANFTGDDLLRLSRSDLIQLCGPADGIRLNNTLQARASRPLLTIYVSPECHQSDTGMREYHAMFLEQLTVEDLKRKIAKKCCIKEDCILSIVKQGPTGIHIHVDDEVIRNFADESHHVMEVLKEPDSELIKILLK